MKNIQEFITKRSRRGHTIESILDAMYKAEDEERAELEQLINYAESLFESYEEQEVV